MCECSDCGQAVHVAVGLDWDDGDVCWSCQIKRLQAELADTRRAIKMILGRCDDTPWESVPESEVDSHVHFVRA